MLHEPPQMSAADFQWYLEEPVGVNAKGEILAPTKPGLGVQPDAEKLAHYQVSV
jgi:L-alanine-DL-glutamate epimerase-like enolase superfamily enzyme